jgi:hypothetical protein
VAAPLESSVVSRLSRETQIIELYVPPK